MHQPASKYTRVAASQTDSEIESGNAFWVYGIHAAATSAGAGTVTVEESDGSTVIFTIELAASNSYNLQTPFYARNGVDITTSANISCTVFHDHAGR